MFWKQAKKNDPKNNGESDESEAADATPAEASSSKSTRLSLAPVKALGRWSYRAQKRRNIAFMPDHGVTPEMLRLQEKLAEHNLQPKKSAASTALITQAWN